MSDQMPDAGKMPEACPFCGAGIAILDDGRECRASDNTSASFACLTSWHKDYPNPRRLQSTPCERIERNNLTAERDRLRERVALLERIGNCMVGWSNRPRAAGDWRMAMDPTQAAVPCQDCDGNGISAGCDCPDCGGSGIAGWRVKA